MQLFQSTVYSLLQSSKPTCLEGRRYSWNKLNADWMISGAGEWFMRKTITSKHATRFESTRFA